MLKNSLVVEKSTKLCMIRASFLMIAAKSGAEALSPVSAGQERGLGSLTRRAVALWLWLHCATIFCLVLWCWSNYMSLTLIKCMWFFVSLKQCSIFTCPQLSFVEFSQMLRILDYISLLRSLGHFQPHALNSCLLSAIYNNHFSS